MHTQTENSAMEDEISLIELWDILAQRKYWILACVAVSLAAAGAYLLIKAPVYEACSGQVISDTSISQIAAISRS